jgi:hypothetical protein
MTSERIPTEITSSTRGGRRSLRLAATVAVPFAIALALVGCSSEDSGTATTGTTIADGSTSTESVPTSDAPANDGQSGGGQTGGGQTGGGQTGGQTGGGSPTPTNPPAAAAPVINSFETPENIDCHNGNFQEFTATWSTTNAVNVTISIDGPGVYDTYGPNGEASLPFNCSSSHTFLLTAHGSDGQTATRSVTLAPRNVQGATTEEP